MATEDNAAKSDIARLSQRIREELRREGGSVLGGKALRRALGYQSSSALSKAISRHKLPLNFFTIPGRRGYFVLALDLADFIAEQRARSGTK